MGAEQNVKSSVCIGCNAGFALQTAAEVNAARAEAGSAVPAALKAYFIILIGFKSAVSRGHLKRQRDICAERHGGS